MMKTIILLALMTLAGTALAQNPSYARCDAETYWIKPWQKRQALVQPSSGFSNPNAFGDFYFAISTAAGSIALISPTSQMGVVVRLLSGAVAGGGEQISGRSGGNVNTIYRVGRNVIFNSSVAVTNTSNVRAFFGVTDTFCSNSDDPGGNYALFLATTNSTAGFANNAWVTITKDNTTQKTTVTSQALDTSPHRFTITFNDVTPNVVFSIDGVIVATHTANLPTSGTNLGYHLGLFSTTTTIQGMDMEYVTIESDR